jgi:N-acetylglucosaminyldiphosphoundecaprenol N-acetyl-beta-D-mannosaminyltransferase
VADGIGLKFAASRYGKNLKHRFAGADLMLEILKVANEKKQSIFLIANKNGLSTWQETANVIKKVYPKLGVSGVNIFAKTTNYKIPNTKCDIIFCSLGAPHQEILLHKLQGGDLSSAESDEEGDLSGSETMIESLPKPKLVMGVGGSFDFITGKIKRAPNFLRVIGLEWLWRLAIEPRYRFKKIWNAVILFPVKILINK